MRKYHFAKEAFIATLLIVSITFLIKSLPFKNEFLKGVRQDVNGFDIYDMTFTDDTKQTVRDTNIVIVEIGETRDEIAQQIDLIEEFQPKVLAIDAFFEQARDSASDQLLLQAIAKHKNLVLGSRLEEVESGNGKTTLRRVGNFFDTQFRGLRSGYANFVGDDYSVVRTYPPFYKEGNEKLPAFTSEIMQQYSFDKYKVLERRNEKESVINYAGNIPDKYTSISKQELLEYFQSGQLSSLFKNKIVLLGYFVKNEPLVINDLHFSPLNKHIAGKAFPDMYGVVIHANILNMLLNGKYTRLASEMLSYIFAFVFTFLFLWYVIQLYHKTAHPSHAKILFFQFVFILLVIYLFLQTFNLFLFKVPLSPIIISLVLCIELLGLYKLLATFLHKKLSYVTVFTEKH